MSRVCVKASRAFTQTRSILFLLGGRRGGGGVWGRGVEGRGGAGGPVHPPCPLDLGPSDPGTRRGGRGTPHTLRIARGEGGEVSIDHLCDQPGTLPPRQVPGTSSPSISVLPEWPRRCDWQHLWSLCRLDVKRKPEWCPLPTEPPPNSDNPSATTSRRRPSRWLNAPRAKSRTNTFVRQTHALQLRKLTGGGQGSRVDGHTGSCGKTRGGASASDEGARCGQTEAGTS